MTSVGKQLGGTVAPVPLVPMTLAVEQLGGTSTNDPCSIGRAAWLLAVKSRRLGSARPKFQAANLRAIIISNLNSGTWILHPEYGIWRTQASKLVPCPSTSAPQVYAPQS